MSPSLLQHNTPALLLSVSRCPPGRQLLAALPPPAALPSSLLPCALAVASRPAGFCYINDIVLAILELLKVHQR